MTTAEPTIRVLSLGAGRQSTTLALLSAEGVLPKLDAAIFADTGWEPRRVYDHLDRLEREVLTPADIPLYRVSNGNLRDDVLNPNKMRNIPAYTLGPAYEVEVVDEWKLCPDPGCGWRALRQIRDDADTPTLFDTVGQDIGDMGGLFDSVLTVPERATVADLDALAAQWEPDPDDERDINSAAQVAAALRHAGIDQLPDPHPACRSTGRVAARTHTETRRDHGMLNRRCTQLYKLNPILAQTRLLLGATIGEERPCNYCDGTGERIAPWRAKLGDHTPGPCSVCDGAGVTSRIGQPPAGRWAEQWIGFSADEIARVSNRGDTRYSKSRYPLLELGMSIAQCMAYLRARNWHKTKKSACVGCPFHGNEAWRLMRDTDPESWRDACDFDNEFRRGPGMRHERYLHISRVPLQRAPIDRIRPADYGRPDLTDAVYEVDTERMEQGDPDGCSPWACRSGAAVSA